MSKYIEIVGRTEILAAIYDEKNLPTAIICEDSDHSTTPACLHSLRTADLETTELVLVAFADKINVSPTKNPEKIRARLYPFFEDYPDGYHTCMGCYHAHDRGLVEVYHDISDTEDVARKLCEDCA